MIAAGIEYSHSGEGEPVVFLHGIGGNMTSFASQMNALPNFSKFAWNMPGYGESQADKWPPSFEFLSDTLSRFISALSLSKVHIVGHSIGGMLALEHVVRKPQEVLSLTLIGTTPSFGGRDESFRESFLAARLSPLDAGQSMAEMAEKAAPFLVGPDTSGSVIRLVREQLALVSEQTWRGILECLVTFNRRDALPDIGVPCCVISGGKDQNAPSRTMEKMAAQIPAAEYHLLDNIGHMINQEAPGETNSILSQFLGKHQI